MMHVKKGIHLLVICDSEDGLISNMV